MSDIVQHSRQWLEQLIRDRGNITVIPREDTSETVHTLINGTETSMEYTHTATNGDIYILIFTPNETTITLNNEIMTTFSFKRNSDGTAFIENKGSLDRDSDISPNEPITLIGLEDTIVPIEYGVSTMDFVENCGDVEGGSALAENNDRSKIARTLLEEAADIWYTNYVVPFRASQQVLFPEEFQTPISPVITLMKEDSTFDDLPEHTRFGQDFRRLFVEYTVLMESDTNVLPGTTLDDIPELPMYFHLLSQLESPRLEDRTGKVRFQEGMQDETNRYLAFAILRELEGPPVNSEDVDTTIYSLIKRLDADEDIPDYNSLIDYLVRERTQQDVGNWVKNEADRWIDKTNGSKFISDDQITREEEKGKGLFLSVGDFLDDIVPPDTTLTLGDNMDVDGDFMDYSVSDARRLIAKRLESLSNSHNDAHPLVKEHSLRF